MQRSCDSCGEAYEAKLRTSKFCSATCRVRSSRGARKPAEVSHLPAPEDANAEGELAAAVRAELEEAGRWDSSLGQAAFALAVRLGRGGDTGSAMASLNRELRATMVDAVKGAKHAASAVDRRKDELAARRARGA